MVWVYNVHDFFWNWDDRFFLFWPSFNSAFFAGLNSIQLKLSFHKDTDKHLFKSTFYRMNLTLICHNGLPQFWTVKKIRWILLHNQVHKWNILCMYSMFWFEIFELAQLVDHHLILYFLFFCICKFTILWANSPEVMEKTLLSLDANIHVYYKIINGRVS